MSDQIADIQLEHQQYVAPLGDWQRTHSCCELTAADVGNDVCIMGWVQYRRDHGGLIFVDLRDPQGRPHRTQRIRSRHPRARSSPSRGHDQPGHEDRRD